MGKTDTQTHRQTRKNMALEKQWEAAQLLAMRSHHSRTGFTQNANVPVSPFLIVRCDLSLFFILHFSIKTHVFDRFQI